MGIGVVVRAESPVSHHPPPPQRGLCVVPRRGAPGKTRLCQVGKLEPCLGFKLISKRGMVVLFLLDYC